MVLAIGGLVALIALTSGDGDQANNLIATEGPTPPAMQDQYPTVTPAAIQEEYTPAPQRVPTPVLISNEETTLESVQRPLAAATQHPGG